VTIYRDSLGRVRRELPDEISIMDPNSGAGYMLNTKDMTYRKMTVSVSGNAGGRGLVTVQTGAAVFARRPASATGGGRGGEDMPVVFTQTVTEGPNTASVTVNGPTVSMSANSITINGQTNGQTAAASPNKESLGTQTMEGVSAQGERRTSTIEAGAIGNDRPIQIVSERWYSPDLQMEVMTRRSDPRTGEEITRLVNINRAEPDPSLFQVPAGYQLVEAPAGRGGRGGRGGGQ
jgi:hypothetical protein